MEPLLVLLWYRLPFNLRYVRYVLYKVKWYIYKFVKLLWNSNLAGSERLHLKIFDDNTEGWKLLCKLLWHMPIDLWRVEPTLRSVNNSGLSCHLYLSLRKIRWFDAALYFPGFFYCLQPLQSMMDLISDSIRGFIRPRDLNRLPLKCCLTPFEFLFRCMVPECYYCHENSPHLPMIRVFAPIELMNNHGSCKWYGDLTYKTVWSNFVTRFIPLNGFKRE